MRRVAVVAAAVVMSSLSAFAAEVPPPSLAEIRSLDLTGSELARHAGSLASDTVARRRAPGASNFAAAPVPGWTVTQIGNVVFLQDDGTHQCDGQLSNDWFDSCMAGQDAALDAFYAAYPGANPGYAS